MSTTAQVRPASAWHLIPCPSWRADTSDDHQRRRTDHLRRLVSVPASAGELVEMDDDYAAGLVRVDVTREDTDHVAMVSAIVHQPIPGAGLDLHGSVDERWAEAALTAAEARQVATLLMAAADLLDEEAQR